MDLTEHTISYQVMVSKCDIRLERRMHFRRAIFGIIIIPKGGYPTAALVINSILLNIFEWVNTLLRHLQCRLIEISSKYCSYII